MKKYKILLSLILFISCNNNDIIVWENYDESGEIKYNSNHPIDRMRYKRIQSLTSDRNNIFKPFKSFLKSYDTVGHLSLIHI